MSDEAVTQLYELVHSRFRPGGLVPLLSEEGWEETRRRCETACSVLRGSPFNPEVASIVFSECWPNDTPATCAPFWWRTPLGLLVAKHMVKMEHHGLTVTQKTAGLILGKATGTVARLAYNGEFEADDMGRLYLSSVLRRMLRLEKAHAA